MQTELNLIGCMNTAPIDLPLNELIHCSTEQECYRLVLKYDPSKRDDRELAEALELSIDQFSKIKNADHQIRKGNSRAARYRGATFGQDLEELCRNNGFTQWLDLRKKKALIHQRPEATEEEILLNRLAEIRASK